MPQVATPPIDARGAGLDLVVLTSRPEVERIVDDWRDLAARIPGSHYTNTPDWALAWWEAFARDQAVEVATWRDGAGVLQAVAGLVRSNERPHPKAPLNAPVYVNLGSGPGAGDHQALLSTPSARPSVTDWIAAHAGARGVLLRDLDPVVGVPALPPGARLVERSTCPELPLAAWREGTIPSAHFRKRLSYYRRRLGRTDDIVVECLGPTEVDHDLVDRLHELHLMRRAVLGGQSNFVPARLPLLRRLNETAGPDHGPVMVVARDHTGPVGIVYGYVWQKTLSYYQSGWDPRLTPLNIGSILVDEAIAFADRLGMDTFDMLRHRHDYKYRFGAEDRYDETWLLPGWGVGRAFQVGARLHRSDD